MDVEFELLVSDLRAAGDTYRLRSRDCSTVLRSVQAGAALPERAFGMALGSDEVASDYRGWLDHALVLLRGLEARLVATADDLDAGAAMYEQTDRELAAGYQVRSRR